MARQQREKGFPPDPNHATGTQARGRELPRVDELTDLANAHPEDVRGFLGREYRGQEIEAVGGGSIVGARRVLHVSKMRQRPRLISTKKQPGFGGSVARVKNRPSPAAVDHAIRTLLEIAARYSAREGASATGANARLVAAEEAEILPELVRLADALEEEIPIRKVKGTVLTRSVIRAAYFARELAGLVKAAGPSPVEKEKVRDLMELHEATISAEAFGVMMANLSPARVRKQRGPVEAALFAVSRVLNLENDGKEGRGVTVLRNAQSLLEDPGVIAALTERHASAEELKRYVERLIR